MGIWQEKNRISLAFKYHPAIISAVKLGVPGAKFSSYEGFWHFPLDIEVARDVVRIARSFGVGIAVSNELAEWTKRQKALAQSILSPDNPNTDTSTFFPRLRSELPEVVSAMESMPWQMLGAQFIVNQRKVLLADQPGLGKTLQTLAAIRELDVRGPILVVAPRSAVRITWPDEIEKWLGVKEQIYPINAEIPPAARAARVRAARDWGNMNGRAWVLVGPNYLRIKADLDDKGRYKRDGKGNKIIRVVQEAIPELFGIEWHAVVVDESHQTLACATGNVKRQSSQRQGLGALKIKDDGLQIAISGTPFRGKTENLFGTVQWLRPDNYPSYWNWIKRHYGMTQNDALYGPATVKGDQIIDEARFFAELKPIMVRRTKIEIREKYAHIPAVAGFKGKFYAGTHLDPADPSSPVAVWLPMTKKQETQYNEVVKSALISIEGNDDITVNGVLAELVRLKQVANAALTVAGINSNGNVDVEMMLPSNKIDWCFDFVEERLESGTKVLIASQFTRFLNLMSKYFDSKKLDHYLFTGQTKDADRAKFKKEFQSSTGGKGIMLLNTKSGGVSLTLDMADDAVICDKTYIPDDQEQVEDRIDRMSRSHDARIWNLCSLNTIDQDIAVINEEREFANLSVLDGQRGQGFAKRILDATKLRAGVV